MSTTPRTPPPHLHDSPHQSDMTTTWVHHQQIRLALTSIRFMNSMKIDTLTTRLSAILSTARAWFHRNQRRYRLRQRLNMAIMQRSTWGRRGIMALRCLASGRITLWGMSNMNSIRKVDMVMARVIGWASLMP